MDKIDSMDDLENWFKTHNDLKKYVVEGKIDLKNFMQEQNNESDKKAIQKNLDFDLAKSLGFIV